MSEIPSDLTVLNFPIKTKEAQAFWSSKHKCNKMKAIIAFSLNYDNANDNLRRYGYTRAFRKRALIAWGTKTNKPEMAPADFTLSTLSTPWWECMPYVDTAAVADPELKQWLDTTFPTFSINI